MTTLWTALLPTANKTMINDSTNRFLRTSPSSPLKLAGHLMQSISPLASMAVAASRVRVKSAKDETNGAMAKRIGALVLAKRIDAVALAKRQWSVGPDKAVGI